MTRIARSKLVRLMVYYTAARLALIAGLAVIVMGINAVFDLEIPGRFVTVRGLAARIRHLLRSHSDRCDAGSTTR